MGKSVSILNAAFLLDRAVAAGAEKGELLASAGISEKELQRPEALIPYHRIRALWESACAQTGDPAFALHLAEQLLVNDFGPLGLAVRSSATVHQALSRLLGYVEIALPDTKLFLVRKGERTRLCHRYLGDPSLATRHAPELILGLFVIRGNDFLGQEWVPREVTFCHAEPTYIDEYRRIFKAPIHFEAPVNSVAFDTPLIDQPLRTADPDVLSGVEPYVDQFLRRFPYGDDIVEKMHKAMLAAFRAGGEFGVKPMAEALGVSVRTLQRDLRTQGTSHRAILQDVRRELALELLSRRDLSMEQIAEYLGFSETGTFDRAFRIWTQTSPSRYRKQLHRED